MESRKKHNLTATQILVLGVIIAIFLGAIILKLPVSNNEGKNISFIDSLFVSTSCLCVTGLTTVVPVEQFSTFGQVVLMVLIEIGGLGFMSFIALILMLMGKKINLSERVVIKEALNQNNMKGLLNLIKKIFAYTITFETIGAIFLMIKFIPTYGIGKGIFYSFFHSISAFCNAGFDIVGNNNLIPYQYDPIVSITVMWLIIVGGLGFTVWSDIAKSIKLAFKTKMSITRTWKNLTIHTKIVLITTILLLILGTLMTFFLEKDNIAIMKDDTLSQKLMKSAFHSTTLRTAGFTTIDVSSLTATTKFISMLFMFIGGSPGSTAGGIKTSTFAIIILMVLSFIKGNDKTVVFKRKIPFKTLKRAVSLVVISMCIVAVSVVILTVTEKDIEFMGVTYEVFSAFGTVGLTLGVTPMLSVPGKILIMILMYIGRVGPITLSFALFSKYNKKKKHTIKYPDCDLLVG